VTRVPAIASLALLAAPLLSPHPSAAQAVTHRPHPCRIESTDFRGWHAQQLSNDWVKLTIVPQLGGRLMQVSFAGHNYLFINPHFAGKYIPPADVPAGHWINYGGDKIWPMPEGNEDENHWPGPISDNLDDGDYSFKVLHTAPECVVHLEGPADPRTGLQYSRDISIGTDSPEITFHAVMKNASTHPIQWSEQSVSQYDTADPRNPTAFNPNFWAFTPTSPDSVYPGGYHVRFGKPDDPSFSVANNLFSLHWLDLQSEVWVYSPGDWVAVLDATTGYAMIERFTFAKNAEYPGGNAVIFYKNGAPPDGKKDPDADPANPLFYMEAELNSPIIHLAPNATYSMKTTWSPTRILTTTINSSSPANPTSTVEPSGTGVSPVRPEVTVTPAALVTAPLQATRTKKGATITANFSVFYPGELELVFNEPVPAEPPLDEPTDKLVRRSRRLQTASPNEPIVLRREIDVPRDAFSVTIHLLGNKGIDYGPIVKVRLEPPKEGH
jgi:hypothetical protein